MRCGSWSRQVSAVPVVSISENRMEVNSKIRLPQGPVKVHGFTVGLDRNRQADVERGCSPERLSTPIVAAIEAGYDLIVTNYATPDMVGHTGKMDAAVAAVETVDECVGRVVSALHRAGGECLITADHGNAEKMVNHESGQAYTAHTTNPVPLIYVGTRQKVFEEGGALCDIAPTLLMMMDVKQTTEMSGKVLLVEPPPLEESAEDAA